jgi:SOS-response transcriptional repressor LexA
MPKKSDEAGLGEFEGIIDDIVGPNFEFDSGPLDLQPDTDLGTYGIPCTWKKLQQVGVGTPLMQERWAEANLGDKATASQKLRDLLDRRNWIPQDLALALNEKGHKVRRLTRGETSFDVAFLVRTFEALQFESPQHAADAFFEDIFGTEALKLLEAKGRSKRAALARTEKEFREAKTAQVKPPTEGNPAQLVGFNRDPIPLYGKVAAGLGEDVSNVTEAIDLVDPPPACKGPDCYAVFISGDSMEPAMRSGMVAYVAPSLPVRARDFVVVQMLPKASADGKPQTAVIKEYKSIAEEEDGAKSVRVRQYNPPLDMKLKNVDQIHRVVAVEFV